MENILYKAYNMKSDSDMQKSRDELKLISIRWKKWIIFKWNENCEEEFNWYVRRYEMRWKRSDKMRWIEMKCKYEVWSAGWEKWNIKYEENLRYRCNNNNFV